MEAAERSKRVSKNKSMKYQVQNILGKTTCYGRSKHQDKGPENGYHPHGVYSVGTYNSYVRQCTAFAEWAKNEYGVKTVAECEPYVTEYLADYSSRRKASSAHTMKFALQKLFQAIDHKYKIEFSTPRRKRADITKNRHTIYEVKGFDPDHYSKEVNFGKATGLRRSEVLKLRRNNITDNGDGTVSVFVFKGKGGKDRVVQVRPGYEEFVRSLGGNGKERVFSELPSRFPEHVLRREYAQEMYKLYARDISKLPKSDRYVCRKDKKGTIYDKKAMLKVSRLLGHNRIDVIALHWI